MHRPRQVVDENTIEYRRRENRSDKSTKEERAAHNPADPGRIPIWLKYLRNKDGEARRACHQHAENKEEDEEIDSFRLCEHLLAGSRIAKCRAKSL